MGSQQETPQEVHRSRVGEAQSQTTEEARLKDSFQGDGLRAQP